jgi:hypothetical protein
MALDDVQVVATACAPAYYLSAVTGGLTPCPGGSLCDGGTVAASPLAPMQQVVWESTCTPGCLLPAGSVCALGSCTQALTAVPVGDSSIPATRAPQRARRAPPWQAWNFDTGSQAPNFGGVWQAPCTSPTGVRCHLCGAVFLGLQALQVAGVVAGADTTGDVARFCASSVGYQTLSSRPWLHRPPLRPQPFTRGI